MRRRRTSDFSAATRIISNGRGTREITHFYALMSRPTEHPHRDIRANNVPYKPKKFLTLSLNGLKENDFVMVMGYPGGTTRYRESQAVDYAQKVNFPFLYRISQSLERRPRQSRLGRRSETHQGFRAKSPIWTIPKAL